MNHIHMNTNMSMRRDGMGWVEMGWDAEKWDGAYEARVAEGKAGEDLDHARLDELVRHACHMAHMGWDGMGWDGMGWDGRRWDGMGWDGMGWDGMGWDKEAGRD
jgi:hypothetical protein